MVRVLGILESQPDRHTNEFQAEMGSRDAGVWLRGLFDGAGPELGLIDRTLAVDMYSDLPFDFLVKIDIATMANSLEARSPLLDHQVTEFAARLPAHLKIRGRALKYLLRKYADGLLPPAALYRRKQGFGVPVGDWMKGELKPLLDDTLLSSRAAARGDLRRDAKRQRFRVHRRGVARLLAEGGHEVNPGGAGLAMENGFAESFNSRFWDEFRNGEEFKTVADARANASGWQREYNPVRPHSSLNFPTPRAVSAECDQGQHGQPPSAGRGDASTLGNGPPISRGPTNG